MRKLPRRSHPGRRGRRAAWRPAGRRAGCTRCSRTLASTDDGAYTRPARDRTPAAFPLRLAAEAAVLRRPRGTSVPDRRGLSSGADRQSERQDAPHSSPTEARGDRRALGRSALHEVHGLPRDGATFDGVAPFTARGDLDDAEAAYFSAGCDASCGRLRRPGMAVFLDPIETGGWLQTLRANGAGEGPRVRQFLGRRFAGLPNIVWSSGNDFQTLAGRARRAAGARGRTRASRR